MKKIFEDFLNLFFPDPDSDDDSTKNPFWLKVLGFILIVITIVFFVLAAN